MQVAIFEVCRRPEVVKPNSEATILMDCFANLGIEFVLYTNDGIWADRPKAGCIVNKDTIQRTLSNLDIEVAHFAVHGNADGLVLSWSRNDGWMVPKDILTGPEIREMGIFKNKLIVSGACGSAVLADDFLAAGAKSLVAPQDDIEWANLGVFFRSFYSLLIADPNAESALASTVSNYPELASYRVYSRTGIS